MANVSYKHVSKSNFQINSLHPSIREVVRDGIYYVNNNLLSGNAKVYVTDGYRTAEQQNALLKSGRDVTRAGAMKSYHNYGLAFDVGLFVSDNSGAGRKYIKNTQVILNKDYDDDDNPDFKECVTYFRDMLGFSWGGDWTGSFKDYPHFEVKVSLKALRSAYNAGYTFVDNNRKYVRLSYIMEQGHTVSLPYGADLSVENNVGNV